MATINDGIRRTSTIIEPFPAGLDLNRCDINGACLGDWKAATSASFRGGSAVMQSSTGEIVAFDAANGSTLLGIAKWSKVSLGRSAVIDEEIIFGEDDATKTLAHAGLVASSQVVRSALDQGGTTYTVTTDYTINTTNGTITHVSSGGGIDPEEPVYVSYTWSLTEQDYLDQGKNFWNSNDYVTIQHGRITVIEPPALIFTTEFATERTYTLTGAGSNVYANTSGIFTNNSSSAKLCGKIVQLPAAGDPFLGFRFTGVVAANS